MAKIILKTQILIYRFCVIETLPMMILSVDLQTLFTLGPQKFKPSPTAMYYKKVTSSYGTIRCPS